MFRNIIVEVAVNFGPRSEDSLPSMLQVTNLTMASDKTEEPIVAFSKFELAIHKRQNSSSERGLPTCNELSMTG